MRLNSFLASCGVASRRKSEIIIYSGRITINGKIILIPFYDVNPEKDAVKFDGKILKLPEEFSYYVINKPAGYVCAVSDKFDPVILDLLPQNEKRLYPVGRLDKDTEGLLIITNDGKFTQSILHPSNEIHKEYEALLNSPVSNSKLNLWRKGFEIENKKIVPLSVKILKREPFGQWLSVEIAEGLKREVRIMARQLGFKILKLIRRRIGKMILKNLNNGEFTKLSFLELHNKIFSGGSV